jgi:peptidoglycan/xylan/chitin deacetylase (PgdA/CDA1 family)
VSRDRHGLFSVSVDLDGLGCYAAIHGLPAPRGEAALAAVPVVAVDRLCELFHRHRLRATFFAIGGELEIPGAAAALRRAASAGHEIASHSFAHDYALSRRPQAEIEDDLSRAEAAIEKAVGRRPRGFRAPGYTLSPALLAALRARGTLYDSSLLPSPSYAVAKAAAMALHAIRGRRSRSILGAPGQLFGPREPHVRAGVRELPISTLRLLRLPVIGTLALALGTPFSSALVKGGFAGGHLNLELHGIDALDPTDDIPPELPALQPGLRIPAAQKLARLELLLELSREVAEPCTLEEAAGRLLPP